MADKLTDDPFLDAKPSADYWGNGAPDEVDFSLDQASVPPWLMNEAEQLAQIKGVDVSSLTHQEVRRFAYREYRRRLGRTSTRRLVDEPPTLSTAH